MIVDGIREVSRAVDADLQIRELYICPDLYEGKASGSVSANILSKIDSRKVPVFEVSSGVYSKISFGDRDEGVLAVCAAPVLSQWPKTHPGEDLFFVLEEIEKPGNLGAVLRTSDAVGAAGILLSGGDTDIFNPNVIRASLGAVFTVPVVQDTPENFLKFLKKNNITIVATSPDAGGAYTAVDFRKSCAIVMGSEHAGLGDFWLKNADVRVKIPMRGKIDSLNISVAAGVVAYEALRQRGQA